MRLKIFLGILLLYIMSTMSLFAQPVLPCSDSDPDNPCPLDTWVIALAFVAVVFAVMHLYRKQPVIKGGLQ